MIEQMGGWDAPWRCIVLIVTADKVACGLSNRSGRGPRRGSARAATCRGSEVFLAGVGEEVVVRSGLFVLRAPLDELALLQGLDGPGLGLFLAAIAGLTGPTNLAEQV